MVNSGMKYWLYLVKHTKSQTYVRGSWLELEYEYWFLNEGKRDLDIRIDLTPKAKTTKAKIN